MPFVWQQQKYKKIKHLNKNLQIGWKNALFPACLICWQTQQHKKLKHSLKVQYNKFHEKMLILLCLPDLLADPGPLLHVRLLQLCQPR